MTEFQISRGLQEAATNKIEEIRGAGQDEGTFTFAGVEYFLSREEKDETSLVYFGTLANGEGFHLYRRS